MADPKPVDMNDIDWLMSLDPLEWKTDGPEITATIAYHRNQRAMREAGKKPKKDTGPKTTLDLTKLGLRPAAPKINRRV